MKQRSKAQVLVVDDKQSCCFMISEYLTDAGYAVVTASDGVNALVQLEQHKIDLILSDLVMPGMDGLALLREVRSRYGELPFVLLTANGTVDSAVAAMKEGAEDYLLKPIHREELLLIVQRLLDNAQLRKSYHQVLEHERSQYCFQNITSKSVVMAVALERSRQVAHSASTTISLYGESGVGKEVFARAIHVAAGQGLNNFVAINCAAIPETLLETELFGHVKGAFTGADHEREGKCGRARGGTLFLDEIGEMPISLQPKLLRLLEEKVYEKVGSDRLQAAEFRVVVATHRNLEEACKRGVFRQDLYHRLNVFPILIPPLRERKEDIPTLAEHFLGVFRRHHGKPLPGLSQAAMNSMLDYHWPGNVRELRNCLEYAAIIAEGALIRPEHLRLQQAAQQELIDHLAHDGNIKLSFSFTPETFSYDAVHQALLDWALAQSGQNKSSAARLLKASRKLFY